ncbi:MAG: ABC transporter substrate-binding protein [Balneolia bacterium]|nr:ABC transporter substrate-binding protein [Balneolia bacterium]
MTHTTSRLFKTAMYKHVILLFVFLFSAQVALFAQETSPVSYSDEEQALFLEALDNYRAFNYEAAEELFAQLEFMPEARLYRGNSLFALGRYSESKEELRFARSLPFTDISQEATYSLALVHLVQRNYGRGLSLLSELNDTFDPSLQERAATMLSAWNGFLSFDQRLSALEEADSQNLQQDLIRAGIQLHGSDEGRQLINRGQRIRLGRDFIDEMRELQRSVAEERSRAAETEDDDLAENQLKPYTVPQEFSYRVGVVLPQQHRDSDGFEVSRALFYGLLLAVEDHNQNPDTNNIELILLDLSIENDEDENGEFRTDNVLRDFDLREKVEKLITEIRPDILFGPLFSEDARKVAEVARAYEIPVIAPLANTEDLTRNNAYFFHANPTFAERGKRMAEIAVQYLGHRQISIMVDRTTVGVEEARAFRSRAIELGAEIPYYISEDFQARRFELSDFSKYFTSNPNLLGKDDDELERFLLSWVESDALYMPVTGSTAPTIIDLMMTQLLALRSNVQVLGSQEFGLTNINSQAARRFNIVYSEVFYRDNESESVNNFRDDYRAAFGQEPDLFSYIGYDNGSFIASVLSLAGNPVQTTKAIRSHGTFQGIGQRFNFTEGQINAAILPIHFSDDRFRLLELPDEPRFDILALADAEREIEEKLEYMLETYHRDDILELYEQWKNEGIRLSDEFEELFELFDLFNDTEVLNFFGPPTPDDFDDADPVEIDANQ